MDNNNKPRPIARAVRHDWVKRNEVSGGAHITVWICSHCEMWTADLQPADRQEVCDKLDRRKKTRRQAGSLTA